jgi:hypothetical protein
MRCSGLFPGRQIDSQYSVSKRYLQKSANSQPEKGISLRLANLEMKNVRAYL